MRYKLYSRENSAYIHVARIINSVGPYLLYQNALAPIVLSAVARFNINCTLGMLLLLLLCLYSIGEMRLHCARAL